MHLLPKTGEDLHSREQAFGPTAGGTALGPSWVEGTLTADSEHGLVRLKPVERPLKGDERNVISIVDTVNSGDLILPLSVMLVACRNVWRRTAGRAGRYGDIRSLNVEHWQITLGTTGTP